MDLDPGTPQCPMHACRFKKTNVRDDGAFDNFRTQRWQEESGVGVILDSFAVGCCWLMNTAARRRFLLIMGRTFD